MPIKKSFAAVLNVVALSAGLLVIAPNAEARRPVRTQTDYLGDSWNSGIYFPFLEKLARSPQLQQASSGADQQRCDQFYSDINQKRSIKIILGLGYYDDSEGQPFSFNYRDDSTGQLATSNFGMNATIDIAYVHMYTNMFTRKCHGDLRLCGFKEVSPGDFRKTVKNPQGQKVEAVIEMRNSSVTTSTALNMGEQAAERLPARVGSQVGPTQAGVALQLPLVVVVVVEPQDVEALGAAAHDPSMHRRVRRRSSPA